MLDANWRDSWKTLAKCDFWLSDCSNRAYLFLYLCSAFLFIDKTLYGASAQTFWHLFPRGTTQIVICHLRLNSSINATYFNNLRRSSWGKINSSSENSTDNWRWESFLRARFSFFLRFETERSLLLLLKQFTIEKKNLFLFIFKMQKKKDSLIGRGFVNLWRRLHKSAKKKVKSNNFEAVFN